MSISCAPDYSCATRNSKRRKAVAHVAHNRGPRKLFFAFSGLERASVPASQAAVSVGEAGEHALVGKVAVATRLTENVALPGREEDTEPDIGAATRVVILSRSSDRTREPCLCRGRVPG
jgi:hypothetical protein